MTSPRESVQRPFTASERGGQRREEVEHLVGEIAHLRQVGRHERALGERRLAVRAQETAPAPADEAVGVGNGGLPSGRVYSTVSESYQASNSRPCGTGLGADLEQAAAGAALLPALHAAPRVDGGPDLLRERRAREELRRVARDSLRMEHRAQGTEHRQRVTSVRLVPASAVLCSLLFALCSAIGLP